MNIIYKKHKSCPNSILVREFRGEINLDDIVNSWKYIIKQHLITSETKGIINNFLPCEKLFLDLESFKILIAYLKEIKSTKQLKIAVITNKPDIIIFPMLGENQEQELNIKPFTTIKAATNWIILNS